MKRCIVVLEDNDERIAEMDRLLADKFRSSSDGLLARPLTLMSG